MTAELSATRKKIDELQAKLAERQPNKRKGKENRAPNQNVNYCFRHGFMCDHLSKDCPDKQEGHNDWAGKFNTMGSSQHNLEKFLKYMQRNLTKN